MGFCLVNNVAISAAALAAHGEKVAIVDYDAHHGNGTQDCFYRDPRVLYVSLHEYPLYPGTGALSDVGEGDGRGTDDQLPISRRHDGRQLPRGDRRRRASRDQEFGRHG